MISRIAALAALAATGVGLGGCATGPLTSAHLQVSVAATFANLWVHHEDEVGHPHPPVTALGSTATCRKGTAGAVQHGAGADWVCRVTWLVDGPGTPVTAGYNLNVQTDGCYTADGDGPTAVNGAPTLTTAAGTLRVNPLFAFNGCVDTS